MKRRELRAMLGQGGRALYCGLDSSYCSGSFSQFSYWISKTVRALVRSRSREDAHATKKQNQTPIFSLREKARKVQKKNSLREKAKKVDFFFFAKKQKRSKKKSLRE